MTIKEVAKLAGVSPAAVSRYLNGGSLSDAKRESIRSVVEKVGYRPSAAGQMLRTGRVNQIGVIVPKINSESVSQVTAGIADVLSGQKYLMLLGNCGGQERQELEYLTAMQENHVAGIILMGTVLTPAHEDAFRSCTVPLVVTGQKYRNMYCVYHDDFHAAKELTARMIAHGHRKIGFIGADERDAAAGLARRLGAQEALREAGLDAEAMPRLVAEFDEGSGFARAREMAAASPELDGIVCATDLIALGAMSALKTLGRRVPGDVAVAGIGNSWADTIADPQLTTVQLYQHQCGAEAARLLLRLLQNPEAGPVQQIMLGYTVVERGTL